MVCGGKAPALNMAFKLTWRLWMLVICLIFAVLAIAPSFSTKLEIKSLPTDSLAYQQGLRSGMVLEQVNGQPTKTLEEYQSVVNDFFADGMEKRISLTADGQTFVYLTTNVSEITVGQTPRTHITTGLDLSGGARAIIQPVNVTLNEQEMNDLVAITSERLNAFGIRDVSVRSARDLQGNLFMVVEIAGATPADIQELLGKQGKFEAKIGNQTVFVGGEKDISDVCRNNAQCAGIVGCSPVQAGGEACNFRFTIYLRQEAAEHHADVTRNISLDSSGQYLAEKLYLYVDDKEVDSLLVGSDLRGHATTQISIQGSGSGPTRDEALKEAKKQMSRLQTILLTGSLPYKVQIIKLDSISPSLGNEFMKSLLWLALTVFVIVSISIFIKYRKVKITLAVILTMISEALITLGIAALIKWNLDAPSIAGIIAGLGTGVNDQIVLIDEAEGKDEGGRESVKARIKRALFIIIGAFLTIVAAMLPLFWAGAGMLRGFALTTILGVAVGILITRPAFADILKNITKE